MQRTNNIPQPFLDYFTNKLMKDPVAVVVNGSIVVVDKINIPQGYTGPLTEDKKLKARIQAFLVQNPQLNDEIETTNTPSERTHLLKVILLGGAGVGKTCLISKFTDDTYTENHTSQMYTDYKLRPIEALGRLCELKIWDLSTNQNKNNMFDFTRVLQGVNGIILAVDLTDQSSLENAKWMVDIIKHRSYTSIADTPIVLVATKNDKLHEHLIEPKELSEFAAMKNILGPIYTSAKTGEGVNRAFETLSNHIVSTYIKKEDDQSKLQYYRIVLLEYLDAQLARWNNERVAKPNSENNTKIDYIISLRDKIQRLDISELKNEVANMKKTMNVHRVGGMNLISNLFKSPTSYTDLVELFDENNEVRPGVLETQLRNSKR